MKLTIVAASSAVPAGSLQNPYVYRTKQVNSPVARKNVPTQPHVAATARRRPVSEWGCTSVSPTCPH